MTFDEIARLRLSSIRDRVNGRPALVIESRNGETVRDHGRQAFGIRFEIADRLGRLLQHRTNQHTQT
jgi:hypothetical protein